MSAGDNIRTNDSWTSEFMADPMQQAENSMLYFAASTYVMQAGVSVDGYFKIGCGLFYPHVGTLDDMIQAANRLRNWDEIYSAHYLCIGKSNGGRVEPQGFHMEIGGYKLPGQTQRTLEAYAAARCDESEMSNNCSKVILDYLAEANCEHKPLPEEDAQLTAVLPPPAPNSLAERLQPKLLYKEFVHAKQGFAEGEKHAR